MNIRDAINKLNIKSTSSIEFAREKGIYHNKILQYIREIIDYSNEESKHFIKCYYGSEEEPNVKYQMTSHAVEVLNEYIFIKPKSIIKNDVKN